MQPSCKTCRATRPKGSREWCLRQASKSIYGLVWPWALTSCQSSDALLQIIHFNVM